MDILSTIASTKRLEVEAMKKIIAPEAMQRMALETERPTLSMKSSIISKKPGIIAEHKRRSPSKGEIAPMSDVASIAQGYYQAGAAAMSVLTDTPYFGGSLEDLAVARLHAPHLPLLRKEFIIDSYQIYAARVYGADAVLLIASLLSRDEIAILNATAHKLGLETLVEIHSPQEIASVPENADMVGVNNRNLSTFNTDLSNSSRLIELLPKEMVKIAESGIRSPEDIGPLTDIGFDGFLIGEALMSTPSPAQTLKSFTHIQK